jgi:hypothetical protein
MPCSPWRCHLDVGEMARQHRHTPPELCCIPWHLQAASVHAEGFLTAVAEPPSAPQWRTMEEMSAGPYVSTEAMTARAQNSVGHGRVETLVAAGVQRIYGGAGASRNGITDAIRRRADIQ